MIYGFCWVAAALLLLYSYVLIDPNITLVNSPVWAMMREQLVLIGYHQRALSGALFTAVLALLFSAHFLAVKYAKKLSPLKLALLIGLTLLLSYPFLSHDFFNYMFDAKILTFYGKNPYLFKALDFPADPWVRFMHWTHRTYPYGPVFLPLTLIPSFLSFGKFLLSFVFFKSLFVGAYLLSVYLLSKLNRVWAVFFATNPLVLVEGLANAHNDLIAIALSIVGVYFLLQKSKILSRIVLALSIGIKYINAPMILLSNDKTNVFNRLAILVQIGILVYLAIAYEIQPWYFLSFLVFLPFFENLIMSSGILSAGLLFSYYPYVRFGEWDAQKLFAKHAIILVFLGANLIYLVVKSGMIRGKYARH